MSRASNALSCALSDLSLKRYLSPHTQGRDDPMLILLFTPITLPLLTMHADKESSTQHEEKTDPAYMSFWKLDANPPVRSSSQLQYSSAGPKTWPRFQKRQRTWKKLRA